MSTMKRWIVAGLAALVALAAQDDGEKQEPRLPEAGSPAPAFRLNDHRGKAVSVGGESEGWTVLAFYPKAATPG